jgi:hypothetical protein
MAANPAFLLPLGKQVVGRNDQGPVLGILPPEGIDDHQGLDSFAKSYLVRQKMPDVRVREHTPRRRKLMRQRISGNTQRSSHRDRQRLCSTPQRLNAIYKTQVVIHHARLSSGKSSLDSFRLRAA